MLNPALFYSILFSTILNAFFIDFFEKIRFSRKQKNPKICSNRKTEISNIYKSINLCFKLFLTLSSIATLLISFPKLNGKPGSIVGGPINIILRNI